eukprot:55754-Prorocentrum_minimum.AAC.2
MGRRTLGYNLTTNRMRDAWVYSHDGPIGLAVRADPCPLAGGSTPANQTGGGPRGGREGGQNEIRRSGSGWTSQNAGGAPTERTDKGGDVHEAVEVDVIGIATDVIGIMVDVIGVAMDVHAGHDALVIEGAVEVALFLRVRVAVAVAEHDVVAVQRLQQVRVVVVELVHLLVVQSVLRSAASRSVAQSVAQSLSHSVSRSVAQSEEGDPSRVGLQGSRPRAGRLGGPASRGLRAEPVVYF